MGCPYEDDDYNEDEPYDYDYYGPNSDFHHSGFGGHGFDDLPEGTSPTYSPEEPEYKLDDWKREDLKNYNVIMGVLCRIALNRNKRMMRINRESAGAEKHLQCIEADLDAGHCKLMNTQMNGIFRTCLFDFNPYNGKYELSLDN